VSRVAQRTADSPDADAEQELDFARYGWAILHRWWLVVAAVVLGAVIGYLVSLGGGTLFQAKATIYPGEPLTPSSNGQIQSIQTNPSAINQIAKSDSVVASVAAKVGVDPAELKRGISTKAVSGAVARSGQAQLVEIIVRGPWRRQSARAANLLADTVVDRISTYPDAKIDQLEALSATLDQQVAALEGTIQSYRDTLESGNLADIEKLIVVGQLNSAEATRTQLILQRSQNDLSLALARDVERAQVVTQAIPAKVAAKGKTGSIVVGAVIGLVVGLVLALLWDPVRRRLGTAA
jgi:capsular polysaccharide biosynthesis protein